MTTTSDLKKTCYECGSPDGSSLKLCPACIKRGEAERSQRKNTLFIDRSGESDPLAYRLIKMPATVALLVVGLFLITLVILLVVSRLYGIPMLTLLLLATGVVTGTLVIFSWCAIWREAFRWEPPIAWGSLAFPPLVALFVFNAYMGQARSRSWSAIKIMCAAHVVGLMLLSGVILGTHSVNVDLFDRRSYSYAGLDATGGGTVEKPAAPRSAYSTAYGY